VFTFQKFTKNHTKTVQIEQKLPKMTEKSDFFAKKVCYFKKYYYLCTRKSAGRGLLALNPNDNNVIN